MTPTLRRPNDRIAYLRRKGADRLGVQLLRLQPTFGLELRRPMEGLGEGTHMGRVALDPKAVRTTA